MTLPLLDTLDAALAASRVTGPIRGMALVRAAEAEETLRDLTPAVVELLREAVEVMRPYVDSNLMGAAAWLAKMQQPIPRKEASYSGVLSCKIAPSTREE